MFKIIAFRRFAAYKSGSSSQVGSKYLTTKDFEFAVHIIDLFSFELSHYFAIVESQLSDVKVVVQGETTLELIASIARLRDAAFAKTPMDWVANTKLVTVGSSVLEWSLSPLSAVDKERKVRKSTRSTSERSENVADEQIEQAIRRIERINLAELKAESGPREISLAEAAIAVTKELARLRTLQLEESAESQHSVPARISRAKAPRRFKEVRDQARRDLYRVAKKEVFGKAEPSAALLQEYVDKLHLNRQSMPAKQKQEICESLNFWKSELNLQFVFVESPDERDSKKASTPLPCTLTYSTDKGSGAFRIRAIGGRKQLYSKVQFPQLLVRRSDEEGE